MRKNMVKKAAALVVAAAVSLTMTFSFSPVPAIAAENSDQAGNAGNVEYLTTPLSEEEMSQMQEQEPDVIDGVREVPEVEADQVISADTENQVSSNSDTNRVGSSSLGESYDSRAQSWFPGYIKNQGSSQMCWACSLSTAAELSYAKQYGSSPEFSPAHLACFTYNKVADPLGNTSGDKNILKGTTDYSYAGGNPVIAMLSLATWAGCAEESMVPFSSYIEEYEEEVNGVTVKKTRGTKVDSSLMYQDTAVLKNAIRPQNITQIKTQIKNNGSCVANIFYKGTYLSDYCAYYTGKSYNPNHAITIVGWDDNYPKEKFNTQPENDGAWIIQNSWGSSWGDNGYFYMSYEENLSAAVSISVEKADTHDHNYQYDGTSSIGTLTLEQGESVANIYKVKAASSNQVQTLDAISFVTYDDVNTKYDIKVYKNLTSTSKPKSGTLACTMNDVNVGVAGFHTVNLSSKVSLQGNTYYSIVITANKTSVVGAEMDDSNSTDWISFNMSGAKNESFLYSGKSWYDLYSLKSGGETYQLCARIKGYTNDAYTMTMASTKLAYTGSYQKPKVTVKSADGTVLTEGTDYKVSYSNNKYPGTATATVTGLNGTVLNGKKTFSIYVAQVSGFNQSGRGTSYTRLAWEKGACSGYIIYRYRSGSYKKIATITSSKTLTYKNSGLSAGKRYKYKIRPYVSYGSKKWYGSYSSILSAATKPKTVTQCTPATGTSYVKLSWKKQTGSGYELLFADNAQFTNATTYTITSSSTLSKKVSGLTTGTRYYAKVRAYKTCNSKKMYGNYSSVKSVVCK